METSTDTQMPQAPGFVDRKAITSRGGFSDSHLYNLMDRGHFPKPCLVMGRRFTRWNAQVVNSYFTDPKAWIAANCKASA